MRKQISTCIVALLLLFSNGVQSQSKETVFKTDTIASTKNIQFIGVPIAFYTPETEFGFGGGGQLFLLNKSNIYNDRQSNILFSGIYTLNEQFLFEVKPEIYLGKGDYFIDIDYTWEIYPNLFWGIGNSTPDRNEEVYNMTSHKLKMGYLRRLPPNLNFGFEYVFENHEVTEVEEGGILDSGSVLGNDRAVISGLGVNFNLDTRDDVGSPLSGRYYKLNAQFSSELLGATHGYNKFFLDLRTYEPLTKTSILAMQVYSENTFGDAPFQGLAKFGGSYSARGYFYGRFTDSHMYIIQTEYRWRFRPRWTMAAFGLVGEVASAPENFFSISNMKPSAGAGIRFKLLKNKSTWLRLDTGFGENGNNGFYFGINEAF